MNSTPNPKQTTPNEVLEIAPDIVLVAHVDKDAPSLAPDAMSHLAGQHGSGFSGSSSVPPVDTKFRATDVNNVRVAAAPGDIRIPGYQPTIRQRAIRGSIGVLLAACIGLAAMIWQSSYGESVRRFVAKWAPQLVATTSPVSPPQISRSPTPANSPAVQAATTSATAAQPAALTQADDGPALSPDQGSLLQSMARDLAAMGQEIEQLKASIAELKAGQEQVSHETVRPPEQLPRHRALRPATAPPRRPLPYPPLSAATPVSPQAAAAAPPPTAAASVPRSTEPQATAQPQFETVPRPPMPVR